MDSRRTRVRFAPSPTGPLHIGGLRTALFNYLFARHHQGTFILRIEDTDQARYVPGAEEYIIESLQWCGIRIDEGGYAGGEFGPYRQSERKDFYRGFADELVSKGRAYYAFDSPEELEQYRQEEEKDGSPPFQYDASTRGRMKNSLTLSSQEVHRRLESGEHYVIRFLIPENEEVFIQDEIRGEIRVHTGSLDDKVLFKSDGMPTYHLANVVDDHLMWISHVIRGEEWLPSLPLHVLLYEAFDWNKPVFAHLPLLLKPSGKGKLSKRDGDQLGFPVFPLEWRSPDGEIYNGYREAGYFPEAFVNLLVFLGWNPGTEQEIFSMDELTREFSLERVSKGGARFDPEKARWFNHQYLQKKGIAELLPLVKEEVARRGHQVTDETMARILELSRERMHFVKDFWIHAGFFFERPVVYDPQVVAKKWTTDTTEVMVMLRDLLQKIDNFDAKSIENSIRQFLEVRKLGMGQVMIPLRLALVGTQAGPGLFDICEIMGREEVLARIDLAVQTIKT